MSNGYVNHYQMKKVRLEKIKQTKGKCEACGNVANEIHHIDETKHNHNIDNLVVLCHKCHHLYHSGPSATSKFIRLYGMTAKDIGKKLNCTTATICLWHKRGVLEKVLQGGEPPKSRCWYRKKYGFSLAELSTKLYLSKPYLSRLHNSGKLKNILIERGIF